MIFIFRTLLRWIFRWQSAILRRLSGISFSHLSPSPIPDSPLAPWSFSSLSLGSWPLLWWLPFLLLPSSRSFTVDMSWTCARSCRTGSPSPLPSPKKRSAQWGRYFFSFFNEIMLNIFDLFPIDSCLDSIVRAREENTIGIRKENRGELRRRKRALLRIRPFCRSGILFLTYFSRYLFFMWILARNFRPRRHRARRMVWWHTCPPRGTSCVKYLLLYFPCLTLLL